MKPGDLVKIRFWDEPSQDTLIGLIISTVPSRHQHKYEYTNFYKVWVLNTIAEFAIEELELIQESPWEIKNLK